MSLTYTAPLDEMRFTLKEVFDAPKFWQNNEKLSHVDEETVDMILDEMAKFASEVLLPINQSGDEEGAKYLGDGKVATPAGFRQAFAQYAEAGWIGLGGDPNFGGQGMPKMVTMLTEEMLFATNQSFALYPNLTVGASICLLAAASDEQKTKYLEKMYAGQWAGTMCLTEAHAGTDLGIIKTRAVPNDDGSYAITGTKIFITGGEHDLAENIIHLVLAKTPDAPAGSKGISLFIVPKFMVNDDGSLGERNAVQAGSIEHKMGIKASATCVMNFDGAKGYLVGAENTGLAAMFVMMNYERVTMGLQGLGASVLAYQNAARYAQDRLQGRADSGVVNADKVADPIIHFADVRRMLLNAKTNSVAARTFAMYVAQNLDTAKYSDDTAAAKAANAKVALLTPIVKAFVTDKSFAAAIDCQQVFGGHGYIKEWGMEQIVRDTRISQIYEGTNGIQSLDLLGRKVVKDGGVAMSAFLDEIDAAAGASASSHAIVANVKSSVQAVRELTAKLIAASKDDANAINASAVDYLHAVGYLCYGYMYLLIINACEGKAGEFYENKRKLADYFVARSLPSLDAHAKMAAAGSSSIMAFDAGFFA
ncbi:acyl-CoA dehydrogenase C-terminal domain-containing protein [Moraxella sp. FZLJ2107]|uniref:acyl-CoA dehydrogenase C-terminal domain-containing protein n=1 Tax=unclassified Moraxella TaxID=2685852 RepID=UPI0020C861FA|nr:MULTISPECIES: acyl-CoA dehydrogenase C-terminal domain-containing protein [unclassified Moraxella]UTO05898.1 acyl-CoA dehydrogenase C-terminal domain-containing protein [Moraxella sp. FZLJ2107]UTO22634.1 acyl-CoA dehydrogenase C-terminal domain-containing protein [Moraxella sp. FZLJ2109]